MIRLSQYIGDFQPLAHVKGFEGLNFIALICKRNSAVFKAVSNVFVMPQIYKVFIKNKALLLIENKEFGKIVNSTAKIDEILMELDKSSSNELLVKVRNISKTWTIFKQLFKLIKAGGGLVYNEKGELLVINRLGYWDLPKGKKDKGEKMKACAMREVQEETGIQKLEIVGEKQITYHTYFCKWTKRLVLKKCYWYKMKTSSTEALIPQTEEDITDVFWLPKSRIHEFKERSYASISSLFQEEIDWHQHHS